MRHGFGRVPGLPQGDSMSARPLARQSRGPLRLGPVWLAALALAAHAGCQAPPRPDKAGPDRLPGLSARARDFLLRFDLAAPGSAKRRRLLNARCWPHIGPRRQQLRQLAVVKTIERAEAMFMGRHRVVVGVPVTPEIRKAIRAVNNSAPVTGLAPAALAKAPSDTVRIRVEGVTYYAGGDVAIVLVTIRRGRVWVYAQRTLCVFMRDRWRGYAALTGFGRPRPKRPPDFHSA